MPAQATRRLLGAPAGDCDAGKTEPYDPTADPTALKLVIRVRDRSDRDQFDESRLKLDNAAVIRDEAVGRGGIEDDDSRRRTQSFTLDPDRDAGTRISPSRSSSSGYTDATAIVPGTALTPGPKPINWTVDLDKRDVIGETIADLRAKLAAKRQGLSEACSSLKKADEAGMEYIYCRHRPSPGG